MSEFYLEVVEVGVGCELPLEELWIGTVGCWDAGRIGKRCTIGDVGLSPRAIQKVSTEFYSREQESRF
jgi:hypothetical protein